MIADLLSEVFNVAGAVITGLGALFTNIIGLIYGGTPAGLTPFGVLVILVASVPLAWSLVQYFVGLFQKATQIKKGSK